MNGCVKTCVLAVVVWSTVVASAEAGSLTPPFDVHAASASNSSVTVTWADSNAKVTEFVIQRSLKAANGFSSVASAPPTARSWTDSGLSAGTTYYYRLRAKLNGSTSTLSSTVSVTVSTTQADTVPPPVPSNLRSGTVDCGRIDAFWTPVDDAGLRGYNVYRNGSFFRQVLAPSISFTDLTVGASSIYTYGVAAYDSAGNQSAQAFLTVSTPACPVAATVTATPTPVRTATVTRTATPVQTSTPLRTSTPVQTSTPIRTSTPIQTSTPVRTATAVVTSTPVSTATAVRTATTTPVPTVTPVDTAAPWALRMGGTGSDSTKAVAIDGRGDIVVTGSFTGTANFGGGSISTAGSADVMIAKYTNGGTHVWSKRIGATGLDQAFGVAIDRSANCDGAGGTNCVVIAGSFGQTVDFDPGPATASLTAIGAGDVFVAKYSSAGTYLWAKRFGGSNASYGDYLYGVAVDSRSNCDGAGGAGCILFIGSFYDRADFDGVSLAGPAGVMTPYVAKYSGSGQPVWAKTFANTNEGFGRAIAVSATGDVAITGSFKGSMNFGNGTKSSFGNDDVFVAVLRGTDGSGVWSSRHGSGGQDVGYGIAFDRQGNVAVTGSFTSTSGGITFGGATWSANGADIFIAELDGTGAHRWSRRCTGTYTMTRQGTSIATDDDGNVLLAGHFYGSLNCGTDTATLTGAGYADILAAKFSTNGAHLWMDRFGRMGAADSGTGIAVDPTGGQVVSTGLFQGSVEIDGHVLATAGYDDAFLHSLLP